MIGITGQYLLNIDFGFGGDFITPETLSYFKLIEQAGNVLPTFELAFTSKDDSLLSRVHDGSVIKVQLGKTRDDLKDIELSPVSKLMPRKQGTSSWEYIIKGVINKKGYLNNTEAFCSTKMSGVSSALQMASKHFKIDSNTMRSYDTQNWVCAGETPRKFVMDTLLHSDFGSSFPLFAIDASGRFILKDAKKALLGGYKHSFTPSPILKTDIGFNGSPAIEDNTSFLNAWRGQGRSLFIENLSTNDVAPIESVPSPLMALTKKLPLNADIGARYAGRKAQGDNTHGKFWESYNHNLAMIASLMNISIVIGFEGEYRDIKPLDVAILKDFSTENESIMSEALSGMCFVNKVITIIESQNIGTSVILNRESFNNVR